MALGAQTRVMFGAVAEAFSSGERARLACWRWRSRQRELRRDCSAPKSHSSVQVSKIGNSDVNSEHANAFGVANRINTNGQRFGAWPQANSGFTNSEFSADDRIKCPFQPDRSLG